MAKLEWKQHTSIEPGDYSAIIEDIQEVDGQFGPQLEFHFAILDREGDMTDQRIRAWCSAKWGPQTKLLAWARAILGKRCPGPGEPLDTDLLLRRKCDIQVVEKQGPNGPRPAVAGVFPFRSMTAVHDDVEDL